MLKLDKEKFEPIAKKKVKCPNGHQIELYIEGEYERAYLYCPQCTCVFPKTKKELDEI